MLDAVVPSSAASPTVPDRLTPGGPGYRRMSFALFAAGIATFALLYSTQALLPAVSASFGATAYQASWTVSAATGALALCVLPLSALSERFGRRQMMTASLAVAVVIGMLVPFAPSIGWLIALRAVQGAALAGLPASAMAYLAEEVRPKALVAAIGLFVAGNSIGGMSGRILAGWVAQLWGWRVALGAIGLLAVACAVVFHLLIPRARHFSPASLNPKALARTVTGHLSDPLLRRLYAIGALFMTVFGAVYTVIGYRLVDEPFGLPQGVVGSIFLVYLVGTVSSAAAGPAGRPARPPGRALPRRLHDGRGSAALPGRPAGRDPGGPRPHHGGLLRRARGRLVLGEPHGDDGPRPGLGPVPVRLLPGLQRGRNARRRRLPHRRLGRHGRTGRPRGPRRPVDHPLRQQGGPDGASPRRVPGTGAQLRPPRHNRRSPSRVQQAETTAGRT